MISAYGLQKTLRNEKVFNSFNLFIHRIKDERGKSGEKFIGLPPTTPAKLERNAMLQSVGFPLRQWNCDVAIGRFATPPIGSKTISNPANGL